MSNGISAKTDSAGNGLFAWTDRILSASKDQVSSELNGEAVILHLQSGVYYGLNEVGARIWSLLQQPARGKDVLAVLLEEYDVDPEQCEKDLSALLHEMKNLGLIEVHGDEKTA